MKPLNTILAVAALAACTVIAAAPSSRADEKKGKNTMELGNFSVSLAVKDLKTSRAFYEKLGFEQIGGEPAQNWIILQNSTATIGLFQGMFEQNILTFNPGWDRNAKALEKFQDVRDIQAALKKQGIELKTEADGESTGPASFILVDPDGNPILVDQHVPKSGS